MIIASLKLKKVVILPNTPVRNRLESVGHFENKVLAVIIGLEKSN